MEQKNWTDYDRFIVLGDRSSGRLKMNYETFIKFKIVVDALNKIQSQSGHSFALDGQLVANKKVTATEATNILSNIYKCRWNPVTKKLLLVASQLGISLS
ncbi:hypothetical protein HOE22_07905 [Candidatus Woesearchaeota archaeon]|jgi:hypothetical protein|nr:hypothetical protein [Candidatus Woesearchaeota archaeon]MBT7556999.1 hypothetical protein [Candidatus Woesearchaeota archaeon]